MIPARTYLLLLVAGILPWLATPSLGVDYVVGGTQNPWTQAGTTPGGVIAFVDDLADVTDSGTALFDPDSIAGWIVPVRVDPGVNIALGVLDRGGSIDLNLSSTQYDQAQLEGIVTGDHKVAFDRKPVGGRSLQNNGLEIFLDLGARFGVNRIVFYPRMTEQFPFANDFMRGYELYLNDGLAINAFESGQPRFVSPARRVTDNSDTVVVTDVDPQFVRYVKLKSVINAGFEIDELEIYGTGFVPEATYESLPLEMTDRSVWGRIQWSERFTGDPEMSQVEIRVRSGSDDTPDEYLRAVFQNGVRTGLTPTDESGNPLTEESYQQLLRNGKTVIKQTDGANWSPWQLVSNGEILELPAPRRYFQFRADFTNQALNASRAIGELSFEVDSPPVDALIAEVSPARARLGVDTTFTFVAKVLNSSGRDGFGRFEIETPTRVSKIHSVRILDAGGAVVGAADFRDADLQNLPVRDGGFSVLGAETGRFVLGLPTVSGDGTRLEVVFDASVFRYNSRFQGRAYSEDATLPLRSEGGDASDELSTNEQLVRVTLTSRVAGSVRVEPPVLTPNGDGINDVADVTFSVLNLLAPSSLHVTVHDLSGRPLRRLETDRQLGSGRHSFAWDGRDDGGQLVPPGLYLVSVGIDTDSGSEGLVGQVTVVY